MQKLILLFITSILILSVKGQSYKGLRDIHISLTPVSSNLEIDSSIIDNQAAIDSVIYNYYHNEDFSLSLSVLLLDSTQVNKIHIKLGRTEGGNDLFDSYFVFDNYSPGNNTSYERNLFNVIMGLGVFQNLNNIYASVYIESTIGTTSEVIYRQINL
jgi:hypothetical protein